MTPYEVAHGCRPYYPHDPNNWHDSDAYTDGEHSLCTACRSADTQRIDGEDLAPFDKFYKLPEANIEFKAYKCNVCGLKFSWYTPP